MDPSSSLYWHVCVPCFSIGPFCDGLECKFNNDFVVVNLLLQISPCALKSPVEFHLLVRFTPGETLWLLDVELFRDLYGCVGCGARCGAGVARGEGDGAGDSDDDDAGESDCNDPVDWC